ncbi:MAG: glycerophosphodiester phosphodiesterase [Saprospiraceae bacterium]|nr:glycerophosphodiester phosphodiesterase [Saprospiraceae bacterium]
MTYAEVLGYDCGSVVHPNFPDQEKTLARKPSFSAAVVSVDTHTKRYDLPSPRFNIEIKSQPAWDSVFHPKPPIFARLVVDAVMELNIKDRTTIQSFDVRALKEVHRLDSTFSMALLVETSNGLEQDLQNLGFTPAIYSPYYKLVTPELVTQVHTKGMKIIPWTVNDTTEMRNLMAMKVDGIITDYPNFIETAEKK